MIVNHLEEDKHTGSLTLYQNQSLSWRGNKIFLAALTVYMIFFNVLWWMMGAWLILPVSGAELLLVWLLIYQFKLHQQYREHLIFTADEFTIKSGHRRCDNEKSYPRHAVRFLVYEPRTWHPKRLFIQYLDTKIEIAQNLSENDKDELIRILETLLIRPII